MEGPISDDLVYIGTYTGRGQGIYVCRLDSDSGALAVTGVVPDRHPSFLLVHSDYRHLYAVSEVTDYLGEASGAVSAYAIEGNTGALTLLNRRLTFGGAPCYLGQDPAGRHLFVANYVGGNVAVFPLRSDGSLGAATDVVQHTGASGADPARQAAPHVHSALTDPGGVLVLVADLGQDRTALYRLDSSSHLTPHTPECLPAAPGAGPRHLAWHPNGRFLYQINELDSTIGAYGYEPGNATFTALQTISTLPPDAGARPANTGADLHAHPDGRFLYASNRGHDSIVTYEVNQTSGQLRLLGHQSTGGHAPRSFAVDPTGTWILVANQRSDTVVTLRIEPGSGLPRPTGRSLAIPEPVCVTVPPRP